MTLHADIANAIVAGLTAATPGFPVQADVNVGFTPPADAAYGRIWFVDGAEVSRSIGVHRLVVVPVLAYTELFTPIGTGDGAARTLGDIVRDAVRDRVFADGRFKRFDGSGTEGKGDTHYRYQVVALFWRTRRT